MLTRPRWRLLSGVRKASAAIRRPGQLLLSLKGVFLGRESDRWRTKQAGIAASADISRSVEGIRESDAETDTQQAHVAEEKKRG